jgi:hypothetical protein
MAVDSQLAAFLGTWHGTGRGTLPSMPPFDYLEEIRFEDLAGDVAYFQRAWDPATGLTLHAEAGIWRVTGEGQLVASIAQARRNEISAGTIHGGVVELASTATSAAEGVRPVTAGRRSYRLSADELRYEFAMASGVMAEPQPHLVGTLRRAEEPGRSVSRS